MNTSFWLYWGKARKDQDQQGDDYHLLPYHSLDVAACGWVLLSQDYPWIASLAHKLDIPAEQLRRIFVFFLCLHDIGKFSRAFQGLVTGLSDQLVTPIAGIPYAERHDSLGFWLWRESEEFQGVFAEAFGIAPADVKRLQSLDIWFEISTGHHGQPPKRRCARLLAHFDRSDIQAACAFLQHMIDRWLEPEDLALLQDKSLRKKLKPISWRLAGIAVLADWLGSSQDYFQYSAKVVPLQAYWDRQALPGAMKVVQSVNLRSHPVDPFESIQQLFSFVQQPTPLQRYAIEHPLAEEPQLFILEDVTGAGKTEAALVLVHRLMSAGLAAGLYVGLPTMATANAMYTRLAASYRRLYLESEAPSLVLAHGARHLSDAFSESVGLAEQQQDMDYARDELSASAYCNAWLADSRKKALLADIGVGTIDQALLGILPARHQSLRLLGLDRKVLLVDEVHAYDPYMKKLLESLLEMHAIQGGSAILLSATLPQRMKDDLIAAYARGRMQELPTLDCRDYPLATQFPAQGSIYQTAVATRKEVARTVQVTRLLDESAVLALISKAVEQGQCVCWIRNTVDAARKSFDELHSVLKGKTERIHLFHSRFAMTDRQRIENSTLEWFGKEGDQHTRKGRVLVSTQVVEQSLDLDFDVLITDLAPVDLLLQRAGRLQRHVRDRFGNRLPEGQAEQRMQAVLYVLSPDPLTDADANWLSEQRGSQAVYQDLGVLWRSALVLFERETFAMPEDARTLIETVYSPDTPLLTPDAIEQASGKADAKRYTDTSMANLNMLNIAKGYTQDSNETGWSEEVNVPTRLGDKTVSVVLLKPDDDGAWQPYASEAAHGWDFSTLKIRDSLWAEAEQALPAALKLQMETLQAENKALKWHRLFPLINEFIDWYHPEKGWLGSKGDAV